MFYYLDSTRTPCGPHREEELYIMLRDGSLQQDTLVAQDGGKAWYKLGELYEQHRHSAACPNCGQSVAPEAGIRPRQMPLFCPHCSARLRPVHPKNIFSNMVYSARHPFRFTGKATRREFWSAVLGCILAMPALLFLNGLFLNIYPVYGYETVYCVIAVNACIGLYFFVGMAALCTRRLRDAGISTKPAWGLLAYPLCLLSVNLATLPYFHDLRRTHFLLEAAVALLWLGIIVTILLAVFALAESKEKN